MLQWIGAAVVGHFFPGDGPSQLRNDATIAPQDQRLSSTKRFVAARHEEGCTVNLTCFYFFLDYRAMTSGWQGEPYFRIFGRELVSKPAISSKKSWEGGYRTTTRRNYGTWYCTLTSLPDAYLSRPCFFFLRGPFLVLYCNPSILVSVWTSSNDESSSEKESAYETGHFFRFLVDEARQPMSCLMFFYSRYGRSALLGLFCLLRGRVLR